MLNGKKLKRSFGALLFILFGICTYTNASYTNTYVVNEENIIQTTNGTNETFELLPNMNFNLGGEYNAISVASTLSYETLFNVFWNNNKLYVISSKYGRRPQNPISQGYYTTYCQTNLSGNCCGQYGYQANVITGTFESGYSIEDDRYKNPSSMSLWTKQYAGGSYDQWLEMCFNYEDLQLTNCFCYDRAYPERGSEISGGIGITTNQYYSSWGNNDFSSYFENSPFQGGGQETPTGPETTTIIGQCPTINEILSTYSNNYNTGICYSATRLLTQTGIVNTTAQSIFELYPTFTGWLEDYNYYRQYCENVPTSVCREAFSGNEIKWSLLNKTPENNPIGAYQYCHLQLNIQDKNATTCVMSTGEYYATGVDEAIEEEIQGNQSVLDIMLNSFNNLKDELPSFSSGTVFDEFLEEGETWKDGFKLDIFKTFLELWSKITSIFIFRHQYDGIIPTYITSIIMIILLFKILKK